MPGPPRADGGADASGQLSQCTILPALTRVQGMLHGQGTVGTQIPSPAASQGPQPSVDVNARHRQTTCAEPPGSAATSQETSSHVLHESPLTPIAPGCTPGQNTLFTIKMEGQYDIHRELYSLCNIYIFNLNITYLFKYR